MGNHLGDCAIKKPQLNKGTHSEEDAISKCPQILESGKKQSKS